MLSFGIRKERLLWVEMGATASILGEGVLGLLDESLCQTSTPAPHTPPLQATAASAGIGSAGAGVKVGPGVDEIDAEDICALLDPPQRVAGGASAQSQEIRDDVPGVQLLTGTAQGKVQAAALEALAYDAKKQIAIAAGATLPLIALLRDGTAKGKEKAAGTLWMLAVNEDNKVSIALAGAIPLLIALLRDGTAKGKENAAVALLNLAANADNQVIIAAAGAIPFLVVLLRKGTTKGKEKAAGALNNLAMNDDNKVAIAAAGAIPSLVGLLLLGTKQGKEKAAGALWNLAVIADNQVSIAAAGAIPLLVLLLREGTEGGKENAAGALWNLAINVDNKVSIMREGFDVLTAASAKWTGELSEKCNVILRML